MLSWLGVLPIVGNLVNGVSAYFNKKQDVDLEKYKVKGVVDVEALRQDTEIIKARVDLAKTRSNDSVDKWGRRLIIYPGGVWIAIGFYDSAFRNIIPELTWRTLELPPQLEYIPHMICAYLLISSFKK